MLVLFQSYVIFLPLCRKSTAKTLFILLFSPFLEKHSVKSNFAPRLLDKNIGEQLCEMNSLRGFHVLLNVCRGLCFHHNCRQENTVTHMREREREWQSITGYIACCVVWKNFQKAAIEVAVENELRAVNPLSSSLPARGCLFQSL